MSYILDALKKSEQERARGTIPDIKTMHQPTAAKAKKTSHWPFVLLVVLLFNAGALGYWIYQQNRQPSVVTVDAGEATPDESLQSSENSSDSKAKNVQEQLARNLAALADSGKNSRSPTPQEDTIKSKSASSKNTTAKPASEPKPKPIPKHESDKPNVIFSDQPLTVSPTEMENVETVEDLSALKDVEITPQNTTDFSNAVSAETSDDIIYNIAELPDEVKRQLPAISFAGHVYSSKKSQRSVMLNGKKLLEGQEVAKGLLLEEITLEGVVLRSQGYRFKLGALQDWSF